MAAVVSFTPLMGVEPHDPACSLLRIDDFNILLDIGWDASFDESKLQLLKQVLPDVDAVLITFGDLRHIGALPYAVKLGLDVPIYCSNPVHMMGQMFVYDAVQDRLQYNLPFDLDDVDKAFELCTQVKYAQDISLTDKGAGIKLAPYSAGHMVGGTIWQILYLTENIVYAVDYNHRRERHLNNHQLELCVRPSVLITDAFNASHKHEKRKNRDGLLIAKILETLRKGGDVLLPVDAAGRTLELLVMLNALWLSKQFSYPLAFLSHTGKTTVDFASRQLEFMSEQMMNAIDAGDNPFKLKAVRMCNSMQELNNLSKPRVILASSETLDYGFAQQVFVDMAAEEENLVILTQRTAPHTFAAQLMKHIEHNSQPPYNMEVRRLRLEELRGEELAAYTAQKELEREQQQLEDAKQEDESSEDEDGDDVLIVDGTGPLRKRRRIKIAPAFPMYPCTEVKKQYDSFGEPVDFSKFQEVVTADHENESGRLEEMKDLDSTDAAAAAVPIEEEEEEDEVPTKTVLDVFKIRVKCQSMFIDFEGRSDGASMRKIIQKVGPRKLILLQGTAAGKASLAADCKKSKAVKEVLIPSTNQLVDLSSDTSVYNVSVTDDLLASLTFTAVGDIDMGFVDAEVKVDYARSQIPMLVPAPAKAVKGHPALFLGDVKLPDLKTLLARNGIESAFCGGVLVCGDGFVNIRKVTATKVSVQGALCDDYFKIRNIVYSMFEVV